MDGVKTVPRLKEGNYPGFPWFEETPTALEIMTVLDRCAENFELGLISGDSGAGKTSALRVWCADDEPTRALITVTEATNSKNGILQDMLKALGIWSWSSGEGAYRDIAYKLNQGQSKVQIFVIDEAHKLGDKALQLCRDLHDETSVGMVLCGGVRLRERLYGRRKGNEVWAEVRSRIAMPLFLDGITPEDIEALASRFGIAGKHSIELLCREALQPGGLREVTKICDLASRLAGAGNGVSHEHIEQVIKQRGIGMGARI